LSSQKLSSLLKVAGHPRLKVDVKGEEHVNGTSDLSGLMQIRVWPRIAIKFKFGSILITFSTLVHTNNHADHFWEASCGINRRNEQILRLECFTLQL